MPIGTVMSRLARARGRLIATIGSKEETELILRAALHTGRGLPANLLLPL